MRGHWFCRLLALMLALILAAPCLAVAEEEIVVTEMVEAPIVDEGEIALDSLEDGVVEVPVEEIAEETVGKIEEEPVDTPVETAGEEDSVEEAVEECFDASIGQSFETSFEESTEALVAEAEPTVEDVVVFDEEAEDLSMKATDPYAPAAIAIDPSAGTDFWLGMGPSQLNVLLEPADAQTTLKWKSSKKKVAKVDANGLLTPRKAGTTKITVKSGNKKKSTIKVTIHRNLVNNLYPKPTRGDIKALGGDWEIWPKSVERTAGGNYVAKFYLLNGAGKSSQITNFGVQLFVGDTVVAQKYLSKIKIVCEKGKSKVFKVTFSDADLIVSDPILLPQYGVENVHLALISEPDLIYKKKVTKTKATAQTTTQTTTQTIGGNTYILNTKSKKFHYDSCGIADRISLSNRDTYTGSRDDLIARGYSPCGDCKP